MSQPPWNPCLDCGACCAYFRASFHWSEADPAAGGRTPPELTTKLTPHHAVMRGTEHIPPRCVALEGEIGKRVRCSIHPLRPSPCRELQASWIDGVRNERCDRARAAHGLPPLAPPDPPSRKRFEPPQPAPRLSPAGDDSPLSAPTLTL